jgi:rubrerythrin
MEKKFMTNNNDVNILIEALKVEHFAIATYEIAVGTGLLNEETVKTAKLFQSHHGHHAVKVKETIEKLGGDPPKALSKEEYLKQLPIEKLTDQEAIVRYALTLEKKATIIYLGTVSEFENRKIAQAAASISGEEAMHWAALRQALGMIPVHISFIPLSEEEVID